MVVSRLALLLLELQQKCPGSRPVAQGHVTLKRPELAIEGIGFRRLGAGGLNAASRLNDHGIGPDPADYPGRLSHDGLLLVITLLAGLFECHLARRGPGLE